MRIIIATSEMLAINRAVGILIVIWRRRSATVSVPIIPAPPRELHRLFHDFGDMSRPFQASAYGADGFATAEWAGNLGCRRLRTAESTASACQVSACGA